ncbi:helix-turn-helix domain-containing protein [Pseudooceanicola spongiae]|uniref:Helix-turn-helix domain-containing protein n=1 Tax=Pseudooceanicola spongiae TaxID=2613965 RepID=A0A7L9WLH6_9RHOB|nr:helix-turn-helix domain-containing protein [Pseudooceanicola spongiae]QOL79910.1 helix-turn-helix domain-containing protein [Pseudooceanicola spongiae]
MTDMTNSNTTNQSTVAAFSILEEVAAQSQPSRVTDLGIPLGMPRARVYRYLQTLVSLGCVLQDPVTERYRLRLKLFHIGQAIADGTQLTSVTRGRCMPAWSPN